MSVGHHHHHSHELEDEESERKTRIVVIITLVTMVIEIYAGIVTKSMGLLADGWHMGTHAGALSITLYAYYYARTETTVKDKRESVMALAGFTSGIILALVAIYIGLESIDKVVNPQEIKYKEAIIVAFFGLLVNIVCAYILGIEGHNHDHDHDHDHDHGHSHGHDHTHAHVHDAASPHPAQDAPWSILRMTMAGRLSAAVAVCAVVAYHVDEAAYPAGFAGVDVFFVVSGYVVVASLLRRRGDGPRRASRRGSFIFSPRWLG